MISELKNKVVKSVSGNDKGRVSLVVATMDDGYVLIADGKKHRVSNPKRKNPKHVQVIADSGVLLPVTDRVLRKTLRCFADSAIGEEE